MKLTGRVLGRLMQLRRSSKGGAALELAIVFPILMLLIIGAVDYGRLYHTSITVANAARTGAEYGAQDIATAQDTAAIRGFALLDGADRASTLKIAVRTYCECAKAPHACNACSTGEAPDTYVEVTATDTLSTLISYPGLLKKIPVVRKANFRAQ